MIKLQIQPKEKKSIFVTELYGDKNGNLMEIVDGYSEGFAVIKMEKEKFESIDFENSRSFIVSDYDEEDHDYDGSFSNDFDVIEGSIEDEGGFYEDCLGGKHELKDVTVTFYGSIDVKAVD